ncbi:recombination regulator RecX [Fredinandcohnia quinoae]|uniref:Regulatory protein RecX n=1 Tax=Fredinandcohnia quinoae TaxID=2918902 RepID=A0AAW5E974_9BACI|nr:recombination regulator RecX [Fredinandcohnia sp. SECRCQ15]MCH1627529.1 recombination regulator RecX [Fredinandcohnia sp. SECRCQ15]
MALITKITTQKKNNERFNIFLDHGQGEEYAFSVDQAVLISFQLKKGMELDELDITEIQFDDEVKKAFNLALVFLSYRMRSKKEIIDYLKKKEVEEPIIPEVIHKLIEYKYVNDLEFAKAYVQTQINTTVKGPSVIKQELFEKGIEQDHISNSLELFSSEMQIQKAVKLIEKTITSTKNMSDMLLKQKLEQTLMRKGYGWDIIQIALEEVEVDKDDNEEWEALEHHGNKAHRKYEKLDGWEYNQKMKQTLFRKGFSIELIDKFIESLKDGD